MDKYNFTKNNPADKIWWVDDPDKIGEFRFSFDKKRVFNLFSDYPYKLTPAQRDLFAKENPEWSEFFKGKP